MISKLQTADVLVSSGPRHIIKMMVEMIDQLTDTIVIRLAEPVDFWSSLDITSVE